MDVDLGEDKSEPDGQSGDVEVELRGEATESR
jgi:hypothetical protein